MKYSRIRLDGEALVVTFDMCSSSSIMEQLLLAGEMRCLTDFLTAIKRKLAAEQQTVPFDPYKFTGDGWILLFPSDTDGAALIAFLERLCRFYENEFRTRVQPNLTNPPKLVGLSFGIDRGWLSSMKMYGQPEYIGRPLNIACRLQGAVKDKGGSPAYKALMTHGAFQKYFANLPNLKVANAKRILRNINHETPFGCRKIFLLGNTKAATYKRVVEAPPR